jgi:hypothetical protein
VKAISIGSTRSREGRKKKAVDGSAHVAFTSFLIDFQAVFSSGCQF